MTLQLRHKLALFVCPEISAEQPAETVGARPTECAEPRTLTVAESVSPDNLLALANLICVHNGWKLSTLSRYAANDGKFFKGLEDGKSCTLRTASKLLSWFSDNWPEELEWPSEIPRPGVKAASEVFAANVLTSSDDVWRPALIADGRLHWIAPATGSEGEDYLRKVSAAYVHANQTVPDAILGALPEGAGSDAASYEAAVQEIDREFALKLNASRVEHAKEILKVIEVIQKHGLPSDDDPAFDALAHKLAPLIL